MHACKPQFEAWYEIWYEMREIYLAGQSKKRVPQPQPLNVWYLTPFALTVRVLPAGYLPRVYPALACSVLYSRPCATTRSCRGPEAENKVLHAGLLSKRGRRYGECQRRWGDCPLIAATPSCVAAGNSGTYVGGALSSCTLQPFNFLTCRHSPTAARVKQSSQ